MVQTVVSESPPSGRATGTPSPIDAEMKRFHTAWLLHGTASDAPAYERQIARLLAEKDALS